MDPAPPEPGVISRAGGSGTTWLASALGNQACHLGLSVPYVRLPRLLEMLPSAHGDGSCPRLMNQLAKTNLLILEES